MGKAQALREKKPPEIGRNCGRERQAFPALETEDECAGARLLKLHPSQPAMMEKGKTVSSA